MSNALKVMFAGAGLKLASRDKAGRYSYEGQWERLCKCGHKLGNHTSAAPHSCIEQDFAPMEHGCTCERFRLAK